MANPLLPGPISSHTGGVYLRSLGFGGGSRASISASVGTGVVRELDGSDWVAFMVFMINQLFLSRFSDMRVSATEDDIVSGAAVGADEGRSTVASSSKRLLLKERYQLTVSLPIPARSSVWFNF